MAYEEARYSNHIENMTYRILEYMQISSTQDPSGLVNYLLEAPEGSFPTVQSINVRFRQITGEYPLIPEPTDRSEQSKLDYIARVHLTAVRDGYAMSQRLEQDSGLAAPAVRNVHYHNHHCNNRWGNNSLLHDLIIWDWIMNGGSRGRGHDRRRERDKNNKEGMSAGAVLLLIAMAGSAAVAGLYAVVQTVKTFEELAHNENTWENVAKLGAVGAAATAGVFLGMLLGSSAFAMPVLGAILTAVIFAGTAFKLSNLVHDHYQKSEYTDSMIDKDSRFKLTEEEWINLRDNNYNPYVVNEAIRELGIEMKNINANSMMFWSSANKERRKVLNLLRQLRTGKTDRTILIGKKLFQLTSDYQEADAPLAMEERYVPRPELLEISHATADTPTLYSASPHHAQPYSSFTQQHEPAPDYEPFFSYR